MIAIVVDTLGMVILERRLEVLVFSGRIQPIQNTALLKSIIIKIIKEDSPTLMSV